jgi:hypothetical protein
MVGNHDDWQPVGFWGPYRRYVLFGGLRRSSRTDLLNRETSLSITGQCKF